MEEKDVKIIEDFNYNFFTATRLKVDMPITMYITDEIHDTIMKLLQAYKQDEKMIEVMAEYIAEITDCPAENCNTLLDCENRCSNDDKVIQECWKMYFRKRCE